MQAQITIQGSNRDYTYAFKTKKLPFITKKRFFVFV